MVSHKLIGINLPAPKIQKQQLLNIQTAQSCSVFFLFLTCISVWQWHSVSISLYPKWYIIYFHSIYKLSTEHFVRIDGAGPTQCCITALGATAQQWGDELSHFACYAMEKSSLKAPTAEMQKPCQFNYPSTRPRRSTHDSPTLLWNYLSLQVRH